MPCLKESSRTRYRTVAFRMSDEERELLERRVEAAGCQKQDYLIKAVLGQRVNVIGNETLFARLRGMLGAVLDELRRLDDPSLVSDGDVTNLRVAIELVESVRPLEPPAGAKGAAQSARRCILGGS